MNKLLEPAVRWMNRLKYAYYFAVIGVLIFLRKLQVQVEHFGKVER